MLKWKLKILSGVHQDAEILLNQGDNTFGSDPESCDFVLSDPAINPIHFSLSVDNSIISLSNVSQPCSIDGDEAVFESLEGSLSEETPSDEVQEDAGEFGEETSDEGAQAADTTEEPSLVLSGMQQVVSIGPVNFVVAQFDDEWSYTWPVPAKPAPKVAEEPANDDEPVEDNLTVAQEGDDVQVAAAVSAQSAGAIEASSYSLSWTKSIFAGFFSGLSTCVLFVYLSHSGFLPNTQFMHETAPSQMVQESSIERAYDMLAELNLPHITIEYATNGQDLLVKGYVDNLAAKNRLENRLKLLSVGYRLSVVLNDQMLSSVESLLQSMGLNELTANLVPEKAGSIDFHGKIANRNQWERMEAILRTDVKGLKDWELHLEEENYTNILTAMFEASGISDKLTLTEAANGAFELTGKTLSGTDKKVLRDLMAKFRADYADAPQVAYKTVQPKQAKPTISINFPIQSIKIGAVPFVTLTDNQKYFEGARLPNGYRIRYIEENRVELEKGGKIIAIRLGPQKEDAVRRKVADDENRHA